MLQHGTRNLKGKVESLDNQQHGNQPADSAERQPPSAPAAAQPQAVTYVTVEGKSGRNTAHELAREFKWFEALSLLINGMLAIIGICALWVYNGQLKVMRRQLDQMKVSSSQTDRLITEAARQSESARIAANAARSAADTARFALKASTTDFRQQVRPYVIIESTRANGPPREGIKLGIESIVKNTGATPALDVQVGYYFNFQNALPCVFGLPWNNSQGTSMDIGAGLSRSVRTFGERGLTKSEVDGINDGRRIICYSIDVRYADIFGQAHELNSCSFYKPPKAGTEVGEGDLYLWACPKSPIEPRKNY